METDAQVKSNDPDVKMLAIRNSIDLDEDEALEVIMDGLQDSSAPVRAQAARILAEFPGEHMLVPLLGLLRDGDQGVRTAAAETLAECNQVGLVGLYEHWVEDEDPFVRASVLRAIRPLRIPGAGVFALAGLRHSSVAVRLESAGVLGYLQDYAYLKDLSDVACNDISPEVRKTAMGALGYAVSSDALTALLHGLRDTAWQVREESAGVIGKLKVAATSERLREVLGTESYWQVIAKVLVALGKLRSKDALYAIEGMLAYPVSNVRKEAAMSLGEIGDARSLGSLRKSLLDRDPDVRKLAAWAIARIETDGSA